MAERLHANPRPKYVKHAKDRRLIAEQDISHSDDTKPILIGSSIHLPKHGYIFVDKANRVIKLVTDDFQNTSMLKLTSCPFGLCRSNRRRDQFYVTEPDAQLVHLVVVEEGHMRVMNSTNIEEECRGITCWKSGIALSVMRERFRGTLGLLDYNCKVKKKTWETELSTKLFKAPWYLENINDGRDVVISDQGNHSVICLDTKTLSTRFVFKEEILIGPRSLCIDSRDNIYVIGSSEVCHNVVKLSKDGKCLDIVLSRGEGLNYPSGIGYNAKDDCFVLQANKEKPFISVYKL